MNISSRFPEVDSECLEQQMEKLLLNAESQKQATFENTTKTTVI